MLLGITGTDGAGKGAAVDYLTRKYGFEHFSARELIIAEANRLGLPSDRAHLRISANNMREAEGPDIIVKIALARIKERGVIHAVVESIRASAEVTKLREARGLLLAIDADRNIRYQRLVGRGSTTDKISFEQFMEQELLEMDDPNPFGLQKRAVMASADYTIMNNGSLRELQVAVDGFLINQGYAG